MIRKVIGWVHRESGRKRPDLEVASLGPLVQRATGLTVREAVKHLPEAGRFRLMGALRKS